MNISDVYEDRIRVVGKGNKERFVYFGKACRKAIDSYMVERNNKELSDILQSRKDMEGYELATNNSLIPRLRIPRNGNSMFYFRQQRAHLMPIMVD